MAADESDRCGYQLGIGRVDEKFAAEPCERPVWGDREWCIWHAPEEGKSRAEFEEFDPGAEENFDGAYLREAELLTVDWFAGASMVGADLNGADLRGVDFSGTNLTMSRLADVSALGADFSMANLEGAILTNADLRRAKLDHARLHETVLTDVHVGGGTTMGGVAFYDEENAPPDLVEEEPLEAAAWVYRQLQKLYQDNGLAQLARRSYYMEKDARRRLAWQQSDYVSALRRELSRWVMRYGESPARIIATSLLVMGLFGLLFPFTGGIQELEGGQPLTYSIENPAEAPSWWIGRVLLKSFYFSIITFTTLGYGDIQPLGPWARFLAGTEALLGALLSALLVFVLARIVTW
jgi:hypothetical protein